MNLSCLRLRPDDIERQEVTKKKSRSKIATSQIKLMQRFDVKLTYGPV
jgi:hypothetical protein